MCRGETLGRKSPTTMHPEDIMVRTRPYLGKTELRLSFNLK